MQRLKSRPQFELVLQGERLALSMHFALYRADLDAVAALAPASGAWRKGVSCWSAVVPKRWARRAVTRNLIRRQIYSLLTHCSQTYPQGAYMIRLRRDFDRRLFPSAASAALKRAVRSELLGLLRMAQRRLGVGESVPVVRTA